MLILFNCIVGDILRDQISMHCVKQQCYKISIYFIIKKKYQSTLIDVICYEIKVS